jgi:hypothetical protein
VVHGVVAADVRAGSRRLQQDVVVLAIEVGHLRFERVGLEIRRCPAGSGILTAPVGVEEQRVWAVRRRLEVVVDVEVLEVGQVVLVLDFDAGVLVEGPGRSCSAGVSCELWPWPWP